jgi:hypothetical protein
MAKQPRPYALQVKLPDPNDITRLNAIVRATGWTASDLIRRLLRAVIVDGPQLRLGHTVETAEHVMGKKAGLS